ncbi:MAG: hypothetical protein JSW71_06045 [Gemmatimonadota bacterium]|nr:MAG: hypothetical protein JSW71_06045 [Gemmatimonadota bacterium]
MKGWLFPILILGLTLSACDRDSPTGPNEPSSVSDRVGVQTSGSDGVCDPPEDGPLVLFDERGTEGDILVVRDACGGRWTCYRTSTGSVCWPNDPEEN